MKKFLFSVKLLKCTGGIVPQRYILVGSLIFTTMVLFGMRNTQTDCLVFALALNDFKPNITYHDYFQSNLRIPWGRKGNAFASSAYYVGYVAGQIPFGVISDKFEARYLLLGGLLSSSLITVMSPLIITLPTWWFSIVLKLGMGVAHAACIPSIFSIISNWAPLKYITSYISLVLSGAPFGRCLSANVAYWFLTKMKNWRVPFYFWGICGSLSGLLTAIFVYSRPAKHPHLSESEKKLLEEKGNSAKPRKIFWTSVFTDSAIWANIAAQVAYHWLVTVVHVNTPHYLMRLSNVNTLDMLIAMTSSYLTLCTTIVISGFAGDYLMRHLYMPTVFLRAIFNYVGCVLGSLVLVVVTYYTASVQLTCIWMTFSMAITGPMFSGLHANVFDLTKNYAGTIEGIVNGLGSVVGIFSEEILLYISPKYSVEEWKRLNWFSFALCFFCSTMFFIWVKTKSANWDLCNNTQEG